MPEHVATVVVRLLRSSQPLAGSKCVPSSCVWCSRGSISSLLPTSYLYSRPQRNRHQTRTYMQASSTRSTLINRTTTPKPSLYRYLSTSTPLSKKSSGSSKSARQSPEIKVHKPDQSIPDNKATANKDAEIDPYDFTELEAGIAKAVSRLKDALTKTRDAGRVSTEMIESLPVELNVKGHDAKGAPAHKEKTKVGDIASVVPKGGRMMQVFCAEEAHVKPISSAIQASPHSLVPQPDQQNPLLLVVPVPPATAETRQQAVAEAKKIMERASTEVRNARGDAQKKFRKMEVQKLVIQDELRKAHKSMEDVVKKGQDEVKKVYDSAVKSLER